MKSRFGLTLIETTIVLAIAGALIAGVWTAAGTAINNHKKTELGKQLSVIISNVHKIYGNRNSYDGLSTNSAIQAGIFAEDMVDTTVAPPVVRHVFNGTIDIININVGGNSQASLVVNGLPQDVCVDFLLKIVGGLTTQADVNYAGFARIKANDLYDTFRMPVTRGGGGDLPTPANIVRACNKDDNTNVVTFNMLLK